MTQQRGGGIPLAWLLTKHEMFMLSVCGRVCGCACRRKTSDKVDVLMVPPTASCTLASRPVKEGNCSPLAEDADIEEGQGINISLAPFLPPPFFFFSDSIFNSRVVGGWVLPTGGKAAW